MVNKDEYMYITACIDTYPTTPYHFNTIMAIHLIVMQQVINMSSEWVLLNQVSVINMESQFSCNNSVAQGRTHELTEGCFSFLSPPFLFLPFSSLSPHPPLLLSP